MFKKFLNTLTTQENQSLIESIMNGYSVLFESMDKIIGYKVMRFDDGVLISGANGRLKFKPEIGSKLRMGGNGIFFGIDKNYVMQYYSGLADNEALLTFEVDPNNILTGEITDREPELSASEVTLIKFEII